MTEGGWGSTTRTLGGLGGIVRLYMLGEHMKSARDMDAPGFIVGGPRNPRFGVFALWFLRAKMVSDHKGHNTIWRPE